MWVAVVLLCVSPGITSCYLTANDEGFLTEAQCREAIDEIASDVTESKLGGLGGCVFIEVDGERV